MEEQYPFLVEGWQFSATKTNFENLRQEVERVAESEIVPNRHVFVSIVGREIEEKVEKQSKYILVSNRKVALQYFYPKRGSILTHLGYNLRGLIDNSYNHSFFCVDIALQQM